ncbi:MAG: response regulator transcription factor [Bacteroidota bacterium]
MTQIGIIDDEVLFRKGLCRLIEDIETANVLLEGNHGQDLLEQLEARKNAGQDLPDLLLLDLQMPVLNGVETAKILQEQYPAIKIIVLSSHFSKAFVLNMIEVGASAFMPKSAPPEEMEMTIQQVAQKGYFYSEQVMAIITENLRSKQKPKASFAVQLTPREKEVLQLICQQYTAQEIAEKLFISRRTVEGHRNNLLMKLNCRNIAGLVVFALQNQLVKVEPSQFW